MPIQKIVVICAVSIVISCNGGKKKDSARDGAENTATVPVDTKDVGDTLDNPNSDGTDESNGDAPAAGTIAVTGMLSNPSGANEVVAISVTGGGASFSDGERVRRAPVSAAGELSLDLTQSGENWVIMMNDQNALALAGEPTPTERLTAVKGFIGMPILGDTLLQLPLKKATESVDLGAIAAPDSDGVAITAVTAADTAATFDVTESKLLEVATTDDIFRHIKNNFANFDGVTQVYYKAKPFFNWRATDKDAVTAYLQPSDMVARGFGIYFDTNDRAAEFSKICSSDGSAGFLNLAIVPPAGTTILQNSVSYTETNPMSNAGLAANQITAGNCGIGTFYAQGGAGNPVGFNVGGDGFESPQVIPSGVWKVKLAANEVAAFDLAMASPIDANGHSRVWIPVMQIVKDGNDFITAIKVKFHRWDRTAGGNIEVMDVSTLNETVQNLSVSLTDNSGIDGGFTGARVSNDMDTITIQRPTGTNNVYTWTNITPAFKIPGTGNANQGSAPHAAVAESVVVGYSINDISFRFDLRVQSN
jgi:hypothetical protein